MYPIDFHARARCCPFDSCGLLAELVLMMVVVAPVDPARLTQAMIGVMLFQGVMGGWRIRSIFVATTVMRCLAGCFDIMMVNRANIRMGISDKVSRASPCTLCRCMHYRVWSFSITVGARLTHACTTVDAVSFNQRVVWWLADHVHAGGRHDLRSSVYDELHARRRPHLKAVPQGGSFSLIPLLRPTLRLAMCKCAKQETMRVHTP